MQSFSFLVFLLPLIYIAFIVWVFWQVISALNRISSGVEDIAITLRRMESKEPQPSPPAE
jgi:hypothetical protein